VTAPPSVAPVIHRTPEIALRQATAALSHHDYSGAADLAREAMSAGGGVHASQAQYVLGQALAGQGNNGGAAAAYYTAYTKQPRGPFAADALLHVGSSLIATGDTNAACEALGQFRASFPTARPGLLKQAAVLRTRARCH
jgi:TolA-binding protein